MKIIDGHIHIGKWSDVFLNYESTVEEAVKVMTSSGIESAVCMTGDLNENEKLFSGINSRKDYKFHFACFINPDDTGLDIFLDKNIKDIAAFKFHPSFQKRRITDDTYRKYIEMAEAHRIPVIVHCGRWKEIASYEYPLEIARRIPGLNVILAHLGGDQPSICVECARAVNDGGYKNVFLGTESVREFYFVNEVVKIAGAERVIFGSDYNLGLPKMYIPIIESLKISAEEKELIFSGNILRVLGIG